MSRIQKLKVAQLPLVLTILVVVGAAWSWVSEFHQTRSMKEVQTSLANFALEGQEGLSGDTSLPSCCRSPATPSSANDTPGCEGCPGSGTSLSLTQDGLPACCAGKSATQTQACSGSARCPGSASSRTSVGDTSTGALEEAAMLDSVSLPESHD